MLGTWKMLFFGGVPCELIMTVARGGPQVNLGSDFSEHRGCHHASRVRYGMQEPEGLTEVAAVEAVGSVCSVLFPLAFIYITGYGAALVYAIYGSRIHPVVYIQNTHRYIIPTLYNRINHTPFSSDTPPKPKDAAGRVTVPLPSPRPHAWPSRAPTWPWRACDRSPCPARLRGRWRAWSG